MNNNKIVFFIISLIVMFASYSFQSAITNNDVTTDTIRIISRKEWGARDPIDIENLTNPVPYVIIHHSYIPGPCWNFTECEQAMRSIQDFHMYERNWFDIGYNFGVGSDGRAYEGRGWSRVGAHAPKFNNKSIGICTIGDWQKTVPPDNQLQTVKDLIAMGVTEGWIAKDYKLLGHRQTRPTECPGQAYFDEIKTWDHFLPCPEVPRSTED